MHNTPTTGESSKGRHCPHPVSQGIGTVINPKGSPETEPTKITRADQRHFMDETATFETYMLFRMSEQEHIQQAYNGENTKSSPLDAETNNALIGSGDNHDRSRVSSSEA